MHLNQMCFIHRIDMARNPLLNRTVSFLHFYFSNSNFENDLSHICLQSLKEYKNYKLGYQSQISQKTLNKRKDSILQKHKNNLYSTKSLKDTNCAETEI